MKNRKTSDYTRVFQLIVDAAGENLKPESIVTDYEALLRTSISTEFPKTKVC